MPAHPHLQLKLGFVTRIAEMDAKFWRFTMWKIVRFCIVFAIVGRLVIERIERSEFLKIVFMAMIVFCSLDKLYKLFKV